jgi:hypothetical protein
MTGPSEVVLPEEALSGDDREGAALRVGAAEGE